MRANRSEAIVRVAVPSPVHGCFDYRLDARGATYPPSVGARIRVPFGRSTRVGVIVALSRESQVAPSRLKSAIEILDPEALLPAELLELLSWASAYYHHPLGEVVASTLPTWLRRGRSTVQPAERRWRLTEAGAGIDVGDLHRAPQQAVLLEQLAAHGDGATRAELNAASSSWGRVLKRLFEKGWVAEVSPEEAERSAEGPAADPTHSPLCAGAPALNSYQAAAVAAVSEHAQRFQPFLLQGVTGSGKTEVYLSLIEQVLARGQQALVLIPEIGLTPQTVERFQRRLPARLSVLHSGLADRERMNAWLRARDGSAGVIVGTRSAVLVPLHSPALFVVDEEHDLSYKQQDGFRYSARDLAVIRAQQAGVPVVLGSATPSLESLHNAAEGRYAHLRLPQRVAGAREPKVTVLDVRGRPFNDGLSDELLAELEENLRRGAEREQSLLFLNRRGYAPVLMCHECGWVADCSRCDAHMVYHLPENRVKCHHCGRERRAPDACPQCNANVYPRGVGTQRISEALSTHFPQANIGRLDRDSTRRKGALEDVLRRIRTRHTDILIGTQMLAKGHHFPHVTFVSILDADGGLFGADFRATERMAQLVVQVAGRAGRSEHPGRVLIQTHHPDHPLLQALLQHGYDEFARAALAERQAAALPPFASVALLRAEAPLADRCHEFLNEARDHARAWPEAKLSLLGPVAAPMEKRAGRYRVQLLIHGDKRSALQRFLRSWMPAIHRLKSARRVRWSLDVDPQDMI